jgi:hypothetical protein
MSYGRSDAAAAHGFDGPERLHGARARGGRGGARPTELARRRARRRARGGARSRRTCGGRGRRRRGERRGRRMRRWEELRRGRRGFPPLPLTRGAHQRPTDGIRPSNRETDKNGIEHMKNYNLWHKT